MSILSHATARTTRGTGAGSTCLAVALAAVVALATAAPAAGQASRTRPSGSSGGTAAGTAGSRSSSPPPSTPASAPSSVARTRPDAGDDDGRTRVVRDERSRSDGRDRDVVIVNPWGWWHSYFWRHGWDTWGWYGYPGYGGYGPVWYPRRENERMGALDLDLRPGDTQIYLDGQLIGTADRFDGWPGYLWLDEGDYHFVFFREGFRTIAREYRIHPGLVIDVQDRMVEGESVAPEELIPPRPTPRRDARIRRNEEMRRRAAEAEAAGRPAGTGGDPDWRDRAPEDVVEEDLGAGTLRLTVVPGDASVYLDGRFLGTGEELARLRRGLAIGAGEHLLEVVRPGHAAVAERLVVAEGEEIELEVVLEPRP